MGMMLNKNGIQAYQNEKNKKESNTDLSGKMEKEANTVSLAQKEIMADGFIKISTRDGVKKAAKLLIILGKPISAQILRHLSQEEIQLLIQEMTLIKSIRKVEADKILEDFKEEIKRSSKPSGGILTAQSILSKAFGEEKSNELMRKTVLNTHQKPFDFLGEIDLPLLRLLLKNESLATIGLIIPYLDKKTAANYLESRSEKDRITLIKRISHMQKIDRQTLLNVETGVREKYLRLGSSDSSELNGPEKLAEIMRHMSLSQEEKIIESLNMDTSDLAKNVKDYLYTIDIFLDIEASDLTRLLSEIPDNRIIPLIKIASSEIKDRLESCLSRRRWQQLQEELVYAGPIKRKEADRIVKEILDIVADRHSRKELTLMTRGDEWVL